MTINHKTDIQKGRFQGRKPIGTPSSRGKRHWITEMPFHPSPPKRTAWACARQTYVGYPPTHSRQKRKQKRARNLRVWQAIRRANRGEGSRKYKL
ncbi:uncharacterized protein H6S33_010140 [Morchella sextelata]|uniref:uncharacterized protein n=1 Tax=Morchella sextelata TaxID=1174677 RepID=UPI001D0391DB|nr:uncharacterized protein H6S33_010140 [Morchella sextelata]KAH0612088.1 hypothetical protein H6S33_010140 [Morchella sextelata]